MIAPLTGSEQPSSIVINHASFWVHAYNLPINCLNNRTAKVLATKMGKYEIDESVDDYVRNYLRFKVEIDIREPLMRGFNLKLSGNQFWVGLKYESLPIYCYNYGIIGHLQKQCNRGGSKTFEKLDDIPYGPHIRTSTLKRERFNRAPRFASNSQSARSLNFPDPARLLRPTSNPKDFRNLALKAKAQTTPSQIQAPYLLSLTPNPQLLLLQLTHTCHLMHVP